MDRRPHPTTPGLPVSERRRASTRALPSCGSILLAPVRACGHRGLPEQPARQDLVRQVLVVWAGRASDLPPPLCQVRGLGTTEEKDVEECGKGLRVEAFKGPEDKLALWR